MKRKSLLFGLALVAGLALAIMISRSSNEGVTPLMVAAKDGDITNLERIVFEGVDLDRQSAYGWTALMFASWQGHERVVRLLVEAGADINTVSSKIPARFSTTAGFPETSAIFEAISNQHSSIAFYLLDNDAQPNAGALAVAGARGTPELLKRMVDSGAQVNAISDNQFYRTPLSAAAQNGKIENMVWLLENGADPNLPLPHSSNLIQAVIGLQPQAVTTLLEVGADANAVIGNLKTTALLAAIGTYTSNNHSGQIQIIETLLKNGADPHYRPSERSLTSIERIQKAIEAGIIGSHNPELNPEALERYRRSLEVDRTILALLTSNQN